MESGVFEMCPPADTSVSAGTAVTGQSQHRHSLASCVREVTGRGHRTDYEYLFVRIQAIFADEPMQTCAVTKKKQDLRSTGPDNKTA